MKNFATPAHRVVIGRPEILPEQKAFRAGYLPEIDKVEWIVDKVSQSLGDFGFVTKLKLETGKPKP